MICFPLDNVDYQASALGAWCGTRTRGVYSADAHYAVTPNGDMTVTVSPGLAWLKADEYWGVNAFEVNSTPLAVDTAHGSLPRIDSICVRLDKNQNLASVIIKKGEYSPQPPVAPAPVRDLDYDEICIATVNVRAGATAITANDITDTRLDESLCGLMRDGVTRIPTQTLYDQWLAWFATVQNTLGNDVAGNLLNLINRYKARNATVTLAVADWVAGDGVYTQTKAVSLVPAHCALHAAPAWASREAYNDAECGVSAAGAGSVTFTATAVPTAALTVNLSVSEVDA